MRTNYKTINPSYIDTFKGRRFNRKTHIVVCRICGKSSDMKRHDPDTGKYVSVCGIYDHDRPIASSDNFMLVRIHPETHDGTTLWTVDGCKKWIDPPYYNHFNRTYANSVDTAHEGT